MDRANLILLTYSWKIQNFSPLLLPFFIPLAYYTSVPWFWLLMDKVEPIFLYGVRGSIFVLDSLSLAILTIMFLHVHFIWLFVLCPIFFGLSTSCTSDVSLIFSVLVLSISENPLFVWEVFFLFGCYLPFFAGVCRHSPHVCLANSHLYLCAYVFGIKNLLMPLLFCCIFSLAVLLPIRGIWSFVISTGIPGSLDITSVLFWLGIMLYCWSIQLKLHSNLWSWPSFSATIAVATVVTVATYFITCGVLSSLVSFLSASKYLFVLPLD